MIALHLTTMHLVEVHLNVVHLTTEHLITIHLTAVHINTVHVVESQDSLSFGPQNKTEWALILNGSSKFQNVERVFDYY